MSPSVEMLLSLNSVTWRYFHICTQKSTSFFLADVVLLPHGENLIWCLLLWKILQWTSLHIYFFHFCVKICEKVRHLGHRCVSDFIFNPHRGVCCAVLAFLYSIDPSLCFLKDRALFFPFDALSLSLSERLSTKCLGQDNFKSKLPYSI